jgi:hypothetical protein
MLDTLNREHLAAQARGDTQAATSLGGEIEEAQIEQLQAVEDPTPDQREQLAALEEGHKQRESGGESDGPAFSSESAEERYNALSDEQKAEVTGTGADGKIKVSDVEEVER